MTIGVIRFWRPQGHPEPLSLFLKLSLAIVYRLRQGSHSSSRRLPPRPVPLRFKGRFRMAHVIRYRFALGAAFVLAATHAFAHAQLKKSTPAAGATVAPPNEIRLEFSEGVEPIFSGAMLKAAGGASEPLRPPKLDPNDSKALIVPIPRTLSPGRYSVRWHATSVDRRRTQGTFQFTVK